MKILMSSILLIIFIIHLTCFESCKISSIQLDDENKKADVYLDPDQVSLAIGKGGFNIRLASMLTGYEIDVYEMLMKQMMMLS